jgi:integrase
MTDKAFIFTTKFMASAKPRNGDYTEYRDALSPLRLAVQPSGHKSLIVRYRRPDDGKTAKLTVKDAGTLAAARHAAVAALEKIERGVDPSPRRTAAILTDAGVPDAIEEAVASFLKLHARRKNRASTIAGAEGVFRREVLPAWKGRSVQDIRKRDVIDLIENIAVSGRGYQANRTLGVLSKFFNWLLARDRLTISPVTGAERPHKEEKRQRVLLDTEYRPLWDACEGDEPFGSACRILILSGARREEVSAMRWSELDFERRVWVLPPERTKNGRKFELPLPAQAWDILAGLPQIDGADYVFTTNGRNSIGGGWDKAKRRLSERAGIDPAAWRLHDLRRTAASGMQRLGVRVEVIERALNHVSGVYRGVAGIYQTDPLLDDVRAGLQRWADHVAAEKLTKVVRLRPK